MCFFRKRSSSSTTPTNNPSRTPSPPPTVEYVKQEPAESLPRRAKNRRVPADSSSAIALSVVSSSRDPIDAASDEPRSSKGSAWRAAYGAAKMAIDIAKDSSDMLPPLKAVMVALSVLIQNYDQTADNKDQIGEVEERVQSLGEILTRPVDGQDSEEKARRRALRRVLARIVSKLRPLSEQHGIVRFLRNADHAKILNGFVQDLANAVIDYQTSLQQSIYDNTKRIDDSTKRVDETTNRVDETTNRIDKSANRIDETTKRTDRTANKVDKTTNRINKTANEIKKTSKRIDKTTKEIRETTQDILDAADLELLGKLDPVHNAGYQAGHHDTCLRGTRESVLVEIMQWAKDAQDRHVFWLNGLAGTGKSTIAQTFSEMVEQTGTLGASFFCSRDYIDRRELKNIFPTLAYQLACRYPAFRRHIIRVIKKDPSVASNSLISQLGDLIVGPLASSKISCVIVVDALDECIDDQPASAILSVLGRHVKQLLSVNFFITGRPEPRIRTGFRLPLLEPLTHIFLLHEVKPATVDEDIRSYLQEKLTAVSKRRSDLDLSDPWPCAEDLTALTKKSSGLFIFASTLVRFIESEHHEPNERLQLIITSSDSTLHEGQAGIDPLYTRILVHAFSDVKDATVFTNLRRVLAAVVLAFNPLSRVQIAGILGVSTSLVTRSLRHLHSVLLVPNEDSKEIRVFHKSFPDFLQDRDRCSDPKFFIDSGAYHGTIALDCLKLLKKLKPNPCDLPGFMMNRDIPNLPDLLEDKLGSALRYACGYWAQHVRQSPTTKDHANRLIPFILEFFKKDAVPWIEVVSLENRLESVVRSIYDVLDWLRLVQVSTSDLRTLAQDCLRFTMHFFYPIQQSASHIYHSALPLSPSSSRFRGEIFRGGTRISQFYGRLEFWGVVVRTIAGGSKRFKRTTTLGDRIAIACDDGTVEIYDSLTGVLRLTLSPADPVRAMRGSQDGSVLFCTNLGSSVTSWDIQTGGLIHTFVSRHKVEDIAISSKGRYLAGRLFNGTVKIWEVSTRITRATIGDRSLGVRLCWLEPENHLAVTKGAFVDIWDVVSMEVLRSFPLQDSNIRDMIYSPNLDRLIVVDIRDTIDIINPLQGLSSTFHAPSPQISSFTFSHTTNQLVCGMQNGGLGLFEVSKQQWTNFAHRDRATFVSSLPNGTVVVSFKSSGVQVLSLDDVHPTTQPTITAYIMRAFDQGRMIAIHPTSRDRIVLLAPAKMSQLLTIPISGVHNTPLHDHISFDRTHILCASLDNRMAVCCFKVRDKDYLELWEFRGKNPKWAVEIGDQAPSIGGISPSGTRLVAFYDAGIQTCVCVWSARNGRLEAQLLVDRISPLDITFDSETQFYSHLKTHRLPFILSRSESEDTSHSLREIFRTFNAASSSTPSHSITRHKRLPLIEDSQGRHYDVDESREWVVSDSKRVCWIPPWYIGSDRDSYCWAGCELVMAGNDGTLRKIMFREPS